MEFQKCIDRAMQIRRLIEAKEKQLYGSPWTSQDLEKSFFDTMDQLERHFAEPQ